jgi:hypothetical protein
MRTGSSKNRKKRMRKMDRYEYKHEAGVEEEDLSDICNNAGSEGWRVISITYSTATFEYCVVFERLRLNTPEECEIDKKNLKAFLEQVKKHGQT